MTLRDADMCQRWPHSCVTPDGQYDHPMPNRSLSLTEYPTAMVRLKCAKCGRSGQYRKATLVEKYGREIPLPDLLHLVGASCPKMGRLAISHRNSYVLFGAFSLRMSNVDRPPRALRLPCVRFRRGPLPPALPRSIGPVPPAAEPCQG